MKGYLFFRTLFFAGILFLAGFSSLKIFAAGTERTDAESAEALRAAQKLKTQRMIAQRMRSLTHSLEGMPQPPAFQQNIQLPIVNSNSQQDEKSES